MKYLYINLSFLLISQLTLNAQWFQQYSGASGNLYSCFSMDGITVWAAGANGVILKTTNSGASWIQKTSGTSYAISYVHFFDQSKGIIAGSGGTIKITNDGGETWQSVFGGTYNRLQEGCFINDSVGFLCGDGGILLMTTDRGNNWASSVIAPYNFSFIFFVNETTGFLTSEISGTVWKTTDAGVSWELKQSIGNINIWQIYFVDENNGWFVGEYGTIGKTTDGGETWFGQFSGTNVNLRSVYFHNPDNGWIIGKDEKRLRTTNGGLTWITEHSGYDYEYLYLYFFNEDIGWILGTPGFWSGSPAVILYTDNNGGYPIPVELTSFTADIISQKDIILKWSTATETNNQMFEIERKNANEDYHRVGIVEGSGTTTEPREYTYIDKRVDPGKYFYRLKQIDFNGSFEYSDALEVQVLQPLTFKLEQNFPNPFNPTTTIEYSIPERQFITLQVYDALGQMVSELVNGEKEAGNYDIIFDAARLTGGTYFYRLTSGKYQMTNKMILLK